MLNLTHNQNCTSAIVSFHTSKVSGGKKKDREMLYRYVEESKLLVAALHSLGAGSMIFKNKQ